VDTVVSSWILPATAPIPLRARRSMPSAKIIPRWARLAASIRPQPQRMSLTLAEPAPAASPPARSGDSTPPAPAPAGSAAALGLAKQLGLGLAIFAAVLAAALPFAFISEGLALGAAVCIGSVLVALLARRLRIALMIATLLAVLGAFAATHSIHLALHDTTVPIRLAALAPASGAETRGSPAIAMPAVVVMPVRAELGSGSTSLAGWAFPGALFALWAAGFAAIAASGALARWLWRRLGHG